MLARIARALGWGGQPYAGQHDSLHNDEVTAELTPEELVIEQQHELEVLRGGIRAVLEANSVLVHADTGDLALLRALRQTFGRPALAEQLLRALKRTGAVTAYRDFVDEGVRVRIAATRRDRQRWVQGPQAGPDTVEMDADGSTIVERHVDPQYAAQPTLPPEPQQEYSRLGELPKPGDESAWDAFLDEPATPNTQSHGGSAALGLRPAGGIDPRQPHLFAQGPGGMCTVCRLPFDVALHKESEGPTPA